MLVEDTFRDCLNELHYQILFYMLLQIDICKILQIEYFLIEI